MVRNISYKDRGLKEEINNTVGKPFNIIQILKKGGVGSQRMLVEKASPGLLRSMGKNVSSNFCNMELRPDGIIIRFRYIMDVMAWIIPYRKLSIYKTDKFYSIHAEGEFLQLLPGFKDNNLESFFKRMLQLRSDYLQKYEL